MRFYLKWSAIILGPFALVVAGFIWWQVRNPDRLSRDELDSSFNRDQVERLQLEQRDKLRLEKQWQQQNRPGSVKP